MAVTSRRNVGGVPHETNHLLQEGLSVSVVSGRELGVTPAVCGCRCPASGTAPPSCKRIRISLISRTNKGRAFYWDNGQDFECDWLNGVLQSLQVRVTHSIVKRARSKIIEPNFRVLANFEKQTPWWTGHKPEARPEERLEVLQRQHKRWVEGQDVERPFQILDEIAGLYDQLFCDLNRRAHSGVGMQRVVPEGRGFMSPDEAWNALIGDVTREAIGRETLQQR